MMRVRLTLRLTKHILEDGRSQLFPGGGGVGGGRWGGGGSTWMEIIILQYYKRSIPRPEARSRSDAIGRGGIYTVWTAVCLRLRVMLGRGGIYTVWTAVCLRLELEQVKLNKNELGDRFSQGNPS